MMAAERREIVLAHVRDTAREMAVKVAEDPEVHDLIAGLELTMGELTFAFQEELRRLIPLRSAEEVPALVIMHTYPNWQRDSPEEADSEGSSPSGCTEAGDHGNLAGTLGFSLVPVLAALAHPAERDSCKFEVARSRRAGGSERNR
jgi:hypothetical protein